MKPPSSNVPVKGLLRLSLAGLALGPLACGDDPTALQRVDYASFVALPELGDLGAEGIQVDPSVDHWQLRFSWGDDRDSAILSGGLLTEAQLPDPVRADLAAARASDDGFARNFGCAPAGCYHYVVSVASDVVSVWDTSDELIEFLGAVDFESEAILLLAGMGYIWRPGDRSTGAIRPTANGFEAIVLERVSPCNPLHEDRHLLRIGRSGRIDVIDSEVWQHDVETCY